MSNGLRRIRQNHAEHGQSANVAAIIHFLNPSQDDERRSCRRCPNGVGNIVRRTALLLASVCFLFVGVCNIFGPTRYRATARVKVNAPAVTAVLDTNQVASPFDPAHVRREMKRIISSQVLSQVASKLHLEIQQDDWPKDFGWRLLELGRPRNVNVSPVRNTSFIEISAAHRDAKVAAKIANTIAEVYRTQGYSPPADPRQISDPPVQIMDPAVAPPLPVFPDPALGVSALFFGGVLLALGALVPAKYCRDF